MVIFVPCTLGERLNSWHVFSVIIWYIMADILNIEFIGAAMLCRYTLFLDKVHQFTLMENSESAAESYIDTWIEHVPPFYYNNPHFDGILRLLIDMRRSGGIPAATLYKFAQKALPYIKDKVPPARIGYVMHPEPNFIPQMKIYDQLIRINKDTRRRFFNANEYDAAINWLLENT